MIEVFYQILSFFCSVLALIAIIYLLRSRIKFTKGELQEIIKYFVWGTIFMFGAMAAQLLVDIFNLVNTPINVIKYFFTLVGFSFYVFASNRIYKMSKVLGFASEELPRKLKKVLKS
jgi:hypothetical protein